MFRHLRYRGASVEARSPAGEVALDLLDLNDSATVTWREGVLGAVSVLRAQELLIAKREIALDKRIKAGKVDVVSATNAREALAVLKQELARGLAIFGLALT
jgi:hypothetical protein